MQAILISPSSSKRGIVGRVMDVRCGVCKGDVTQPRGVGGLLGHTTRLELELNAFFCMLSHQKKGRVEG